MKFVIMTYKIQYYQLLGAVLYHEFNHLFLFECIHHEHIKKCTRIESNASYMNQMKIVGSNCVFLKGFTIFKISILVRG